MKELIILFLICSAFSLSTKLIQAGSITNNNEEAIDYQIERGTINLSQSQTDSALFYFKKALISAQKKNLSQKELIIHLKISDCYSSSKEFNKAETELNKSHIILNSIKPTADLESGYYKSLGYFYYCRGNFATAEITLKKALVIQKIPDVFLLLYLEKSCFKQMKISEANNYLNKIKLLPDNEWLVHSMNIDFAVLELALLTRNSKISNIEINLKPILNLIEKKDTFCKISAKAYHYQCLGFTYSYLEEYPKCINYLIIAQKEYELFKDNNKYNSLVSISNELANIYSRINDFTKTEINLNRVSLYKKRLRSFSVSDMCKLYYTFGINSYRKKDYLKSISFFDTASTYIKNTEPDLKANLYNYYGLIYSALGEYTKSQDNFKKAILFRQKESPVNTQNLSKDYQNYSELLSKMGKANEAIEMGKKSCKLIQQVTGQKSSSTSTALASLANIYLENKDYNNALAAFDKALLAASSELTTDKNTLFPEPSSIIYSLEYLRALKGKASTLYTLGKTIKTEKEKYSENSLSCYSEAMELLEKIRSSYQFDNDKLLLTENENTVYNQAVQVAYELYKTTGKEEYINIAFSASEKNKATVLREKISLLMNVPEGSKQYSLYLKDQELRKNISILERKVASSKINTFKWKEQLYKLYDEQEEFFSMLKSEYPKYYNSWAFTVCISLPELQQKLLKTESLIEYILTDSTLYTIVVNSTGKEFIKTPLPDNFKETVYQYMDEVSSSGNDATTLQGFNSFIQNSYGLYSTLIGPIQNYISHKSLIIVSDGLLNVLPFETLLTNSYKNSRVDYRRLPYLITRHTVSYSNSATLFGNPYKTGNKTDHNILAFAPGYTSSNSSIAEAFTRSSNSTLKGAHDEVSSINEIIKGDSYFNQSATETEFKKLAPGYSILHLAMHGEADSDDPGNSCLIFENGGDGNDGNLYAWEIYNMQLNPAMVVLSACNTGTGKLRKGEGVMSLARSFMYAGCPSVVMTLWSISDLSSTDLMKIFYKNLTAGNNKAEALQKAKIQYLTHTGPMNSHPYYWAGYVVLGDKSPVKIDAPANKFVFTSTASLTVFVLVFLFIRRRKLKH